MVDTNSWMGKIPSDWKVSKIGNAYTARNEKVSDLDYQPLSVTMKGVVPQLATAAKSDDHNNRKLVKKGDFCINSRSDRRGSCGISPSDGSVSLINTILEPRDEMIPEYYEWLFHTSQFADEFYKWGHGIVDDLWTTGWSEMKRILIPVPPIREQEQIADFLNRTCADIDSAIEEARSGIQDFRDLKQAIITNAVLGGLKSVETRRESEIEWVGSIPSHWSVTRFIFANWIRGRLGWKGLKADEYVLDGYPFLSAFNIINNKLSWDNLNYITKERYDESPEIKLSIGDILLVKDGAGIGKCARIDDLPLGEATVNSSLAVISPSEGINYKYEYYYLQSNVFQNIIARLRNGMGVPHLTQESMKAIKLPLPPLAEQMEIVDYLEEACMHMDTMIEEKTALINDLDNYRKSFIFGVVTGKRKAV